MRLFISLILFGLCFQGLNAQKASKVDFDSIYIVIHQKGSEFEYSKLHNRFRNGSVLSDRELFLLYYGYTAHRDYNPYNMSEMELQNHIRENGYGKTDKLEEEVFNNNHVSIVACLARAMRYKMRNDTGLMNIWVNNYYGLLRAIRRSGDGRSEASAFVTNSITDEYQVLRYFNLNFTMQLNLERYDAFELVEPNEFGEKRIYFDKIKSREFLNRHFNDKQVAD